MSKKYFVAAKFPTGCPSSFNIWGQEFKTKEDAIEAAKSFLDERSGSKDGLRSMIILESVCDVKFPYPPLEVIDHK